MLACLQRESVRIWLCLSCAAPPQPAENAEGSFIVQASYTDYDELLFKYDDRHLARERVRGKIETVLDEWRGVS
jgi:hypothetical protein